MKVPAAVRRVLNAVTSRPSIMKICRKTLASTNTTSQIYLCITHGNKVKDTHEDLVQATDGAIYVSHR